MNQSNQLKTNRSLKLYSLPLFLLLLSLAAPFVFAQGKSILLHFMPVTDAETQMVDDLAFPLLSFDMTPTNASNVPFLGLDVDNFVLYEDDALVETMGIEPFLDVEQPVSIMVMVDMGSYVNDEVGELKTAVVNLYNTTEQTDESSLLIFRLSDTGTTVNLNEPLQWDAERELPFTNDEGALINLVNKQLPEINAGSPLYDALFKGIRLTDAQAQYDRRAILLISNGIDTDRTGSHNGSQIANADMVIVEAQQKGIPVFTVGWGDGSDSSFLKRMGDETGGAYQSAATAEELSRFFDTIINQLKQNYHIQYTSSLPYDNDWHNLTVVVQINHDRAEETVQFQAHYPIMPLVHDITATQPKQEPFSLKMDQPIKGSIVFEPDFIVRGGVTAVNYYINGSPSATYTAYQPPWTFTLDTTELTPGNEHELLVEVVDNASPPNIGLFESKIKVEACDLICQSGQVIGDRQLQLLAVLGLVSILLIILINIRWKLARKSKSGATDNPPQRLKVRETIVLSGESDDLPQGLEVRETLVLPSKSDDSPQGLQVKETLVLPSKPNDPS